MTHPHRRQQNPRTRVPVPLNPSHMPCYSCPSQERSLLQSGNDWHRNYFMPSSADAPVIGLRR